MRDNALHCRKNWVLKFYCSSMLHPLTMHHICMSDLMAGTNHQMTRSVQCFFFLAERRLWHVSLVPMPNLAAIILWFEPEWFLGEGKNTFCSVFPTTTTNSIPQCSNKGITVVYHSVFRSKLRDRRQPKKYPNEQFRGNLRSGQKLQLQFNIGEAKRHVPIFFLLRNSFEGLKWC